VRTDEIIDVIEVGTLTPVELDTPAPAPVEVGTPAPDHDDDGHTTIVA
jgi:hypothetical protein